MTEQRELLGVTEENNISLTRGYLSGLRKNFLPAPPLDLMLDMIMLTCNENVVSKRNESYLCLTSELQDVFIRALSCIRGVNFSDGADALVKHSKPEKD